MDWRRGSVGTGRGSNRRTSPRCRLSSHRRLSHLRAITLIGSCRGVGCACGNVPIRAKEMPTFVLQPSRRAATAVASVRDPDVNADHSLRNDDQLGVASCQRDAVRVWRRSRIGTLHRCLPSRETSLNFSRLGSGTKTSPRRVRQRSARRVQPIHTCSSGSITDATSSRQHGWEDARRNRHANQPGSSPQRQGFETPVRIESACTRLTDFVLLKPNT